MTDKASEMEDKVCTAMDKVFEMVDMGKVCEALERQLSKELFFHPVRDLARTPCSRALSCWAVLRVNPWDKPPLDRIAPEAYRTLKRILEPYAWPKLRLQPGTVALSVTGGSINPRFNDHPYEEVEFRAILHTAVPESIELIQDTKKFLDSEERRKERLAETAKMLTKLREKATALEI